MSDDALLFYQNLADEYDRMVRFRQRLEKEEAILRRWRERYGFSTALDVACGTGLHAIALARLGVRVTGVDISPEMLRYAQSNAQRYGQSIRWQQANMLELPQVVVGRFQALFCLGNSLPHLQDEKQLHQAIRGFHHVLQPGGIVVLQVLNYNRILQEQRRIINIRREGNTEFIRFYDFGKPHLQFNILIIRQEGTTLQHQLHSTRLYPFRKEEIETALREAGYRDVEVYGDMLFAPYLPDKSPNVVLVAKK